MCLLRTIARNFVSKFGLGEFEDILIRFFFCLNLFCLYFKGLFRAAFSSRSESVGSTSQNKSRFIEFITALTTFREFQNQ